MDIHRKIIHIDMDAFYASVEQRDNPEYKGIPLIVGGKPEGRGVVVAASYEVRKFGVRSAMSSKMAQQLCPHAVFTPPRFNAYSEVSKKIREIFYRYTDIVEPLSLDEAYLDVTTDKLNICSALEIAKQIKQAIQEELNLTASAGVSSSKFVAKIASDINKPDGLTFIGPSKIEAFMEKLPVEKFYGVGKVTANKMKKMGIHFGSDLKKLSENELCKCFGKVGHFYYKIVRGIDDRMVQANRETKSLGVEDTFNNDITNVNEMIIELEKIAKLVVARLEKYQLKGRTITLKIKYHTFKTITRNQSFDIPTNDIRFIIKTIHTLLLKTDLTDKRVRLLGISLSNFEPLHTAYTATLKNQLKLF